MKVKMVKGKHEFDYQPDGILFLPSERVCILQRDSGAQRVVDVSSLEKTVGPEKFKSISSDLMHNNLVTTDNYQIMGLADVDPDQAELL